MASKFDDVLSADIAFRDIAANYSCSVCHKFSSRFLVDKNVRVYFGFLACVGDKTTFYTYKFYNLYMQIFETCCTSKYFLLDF